MASSKIKGITIEINGNTTKLQDALKGVDKQVYALNGDLKALNHALKLDPKNTELLAQKQDVLARNIQASKDKLETLKEAQRQMGDYNKLTDEQKESYNQLSLEIAKSENALKSMNEELKNTHKHDFSKLQEGLKKVGEVALDVSKKVLQISAAAGAAITGVIAKGVKSYAELEKAQKGSERLFGESYKTVEKNAAEAYKTMGLSATEYYDQVNTYAVGLKNALGGDSERAAELANDILKAQADIVAATGVNQDQVQSAFAAVMRGNYSLLDNLRVGIKGSKEGMQEVINKVNEWNAANGNATNYQMGNYADMQQALVDYTKMVDVAGTAEKQMSETISGSLSQMKAAFTNFLSGSGSVSDLTKTITTFLKNVVNAIKKIAPELVKGLVELLNSIAPELLSLIQELLPIVIEGITLLLDGLIKFINTDTEQIIDMAVGILSNLVKFIIQNLPLLLQAAIKIISQLALGIAKELPTLIPVIIDAIILMVETLIENADLLIEAAFALITGLIKGLFQAIPNLIAKLPELVSKIVDGIIEAAPQMITAAGELLVQLGTSLLEGVRDIGQKIVEGLWNGINDKLGWLGDQLSRVKSTITTGFKVLFGIRSPSKVMEEEIGQKLGLGIAKGIDDTVKDVENAMSNLSSGVEASVNPTINPVANTNPLYLSIDKFYNTRETDIQQLAEELEFYRRNSALAKGGV